MAIYKTLVLLIQVFYKYKCFIFMPLEAANPLPDPLTQNTETDYDDALSITLPCPAVNP